MILIFGLTSGEREMNWYKIIKSADQFTDLLSPEEKRKLSDMNRTVVLYQRVIDDISQEKPEEELSDEERQDIKNYQFFVDKVKDEILSFQEWVLKSRSRKEKYSYINKAKEYFGLTDDPNEAGYILPDGTMLDFSGRHAGMSHGLGRAIDHRAVSSLLGKEGLKMTEGMNAFMRLTGAVRIGYYPPVFIVYIKSSITKQQMARIIDISKDVVEVIELEVMDNHRRIEGHITPRKIKESINELFQLKSYKWD